MSNIPNDHSHPIPGATTPNHPNGSGERLDAPTGVLVDEHGKPYANENETRMSKDTQKEILDRVKKSEFLMIFLTGVVAVATLGQAWLAYSNGKSSSTQTDALIAAANSNANSAYSFAQSAWAINWGIRQSVAKLDTQAQEMRKAALSAAQTADESLRVSERAYLVVDLRDDGLGQCALVNKDQFFCGDIHYHNIGRTPAISIVVTGNLAFGFRGNRPLGDLPIPAYDGLSGSTLANGSDGITTLNAKQSMAMLVGDHSLMQNANGGFYLFGYIQYKDIFDKAHITAFCNYHPLGITSTDHLPSQCSTGNWFEKDPVLVKAQATRKAH